MVNTFLVLLAYKAQRERRRIKLSEVIRETGISRDTLNRIADNTAKSYPSTAIDKLCGYLECSVNDLLVLEEVT